MKPTRVRCRLGGFAPCVDDLCHGVDRTMCGLFVDSVDGDVCYHGWAPGTCPEGCDEDDEGDDYPDFGDGE